MGEPSWPITSSSHFVQLVILIPQSREKNLGFLSVYTLTKPIIRDVSRRST
jgi:hypothetical protein